jgi:hypothetical protein
MTSNVDDNSTFDTKLLLKPFHVIRLGYITHFESGSTLTVGDYVGGTKLGVKLKPAYIDFLNSLDATVNDREFDAAELGLISWMAEQNFIMILSYDANITDLNMIPVLRSVIMLDQKNEREYVTCSASSTNFSLSELGGFFFSLVDGVRTLGEIVENVKQGVLNDPSGPLLVTENEKEHGKTFDLILLEEALDFIKATTVAEVITYEPHN